MRSGPQGSAVDIALGLSVEIVHAITVHQNKMMFQSPIGVMKEIVWDYSEKSVRFVLDDGSTSPTFVFPVLTELEAHFTAILALPDLEKPPEQIYIGVLIGQNLPSPIQQRRAIAGFNQPAMLPMAKRRELLRSEQPVRNATSRERLGLEFIRSGFLCFTCSIGSDLRGLTLGVQQLRVFPTPDCHDRSACLFSYSYETLESCEVAGTRLELRFRPTPQLAKQPSYLVFQSLESQHIREAIWMFKLQGQLLKRQNARTFHLRKTWHPKFVVLFETPVGGFLCYYDKITHCPGMTEAPRERRIIDLSSVLCIRPVSSSSPVSRSSHTNSPTMHAFDVVTLYRTWTFAALEPELYEIWLHVLTECVEKHATIAPDKTLRLPVKLAMTGHTSPTEATSLEISAHGVSFCTGHEEEVVLSTWYYTDLEKWSVVFQQGYLCCLLKCRSPAPASPGSPRTSVRDTVTQDFLFRTTEASTICLAIEFYVGKCMAKLEVLAGKFLEENRAQKSKSELVVDPVATKRDTAMPKLQTQLVREHPIETLEVPIIPRIAPVAAEMPAQATPKENVLNGSLSTVGVNAAPTATETGCVKDGIVSPTALDQRSDALPLLILEDPVRETMPTNFPLTILYGSPSDNSTMTTIDTIVDEPQTMQESTFLCR
ncbi:hypothetical protein PInf_018750 [Phytophthora infestans]|nr:hypothetical protein PInf_018750 [Phytophthora infestans]